MKETSENINSTFSNNLKKEFFVKTKSSRTLSNLEEKKFILSSNLLHKSVKDIKINRLDTLGPFLNNYVYKPIEIKNPSVKKMINECDGYGPYYSHCLLCNNKNLGYFKDLKTDDAVRVLKYIQKSKILIN